MIFTSAFCKILCVLLCNIFVDVSQYFFNIISGILKIFHRVLSEIVHDISQYFMQCCCTQMSEISRRMPEFIASPLSRCFVRALFRIAIVLHFLAAFLSMSALASSSVC